MKKNYKLLLGLILFLLLLCIFVSRRSIMEGLTTYTLADYANLSPINAANKNMITDALWKKYTDRYFSFCKYINSASPNKCAYGPNDDLTNLKKFFYDNYTNNEFNYLINEIFDDTNEQLSGLASTSMKSNPYLADWLAKNNIPNNIRTTQLPPSNRQLYEKYVLASEKSMNPQPQSYQIYMGTIPGPPP